MAFVYPASSNSFSEKRTVPSRPTRMLQGTQPLVSCRNHVPSGSGTTGHARPNCAFHVSHDSDVSKAPMQTTSNPCGAKRSKTRPMAGASCRQVSHWPFQNTMSTPSVPLTGRPMSCTAMRVPFETPFDAPSRTFIGLLFEAHHFERLQDAACRASWPPPRGAGIHGGARQHPALYRQFTPATTGGRDAAASVRRRNPKEMTAWQDWTICSRLTA